MKQKVWLKWLVPLAIMLVAILLSFTLDYFGIRAENIALVYIAALLVIMIEGKNIIFGLVITIIFAFVFNFFFTEPRYTFSIDDPNYIITLLIFAIVAFLMNFLTSSLQKEVAVSRDTSQKMTHLYHTSKKVSNLNTEQEIGEVAIKELEQYLSRNVAIILKNNKGHKYIIGDSNIFDINTWEKEIDFSIEYGQICGKGENKFPEVPFKVFPFTSKEANKGALLIAISANQKFGQEEREFVETNVVNISGAIDRVRATIEKEKTRIEIDSERFRNALLKSLSHDLRTPLTTIQSGAGFLIDSFDKLNPETIKSLLADIDFESSQMAQFIENLLNMTRVRSNKLLVGKKRELIDDVLANVKSRMLHHLQNHELQIASKEELLYFHVDSSLILQVFINLIDNAIKHSGDGSTITIDYEQNDTGTLFKVVDNGIGIQESDSETLFADFVTGTDKTQDKKRGMGLGLSICRSIVEAHGGYIKAYNNKTSGATFEFFIPEVIEEHVNDL